MVEYWQLLPGEWSAYPAAPSPPVPPVGTALVVEDEPYLRETLGLMLGRLGFAVQLVQDGVEALAGFQASQGRIDLVLLDLAMPRMDGRQTFHSLRRLRPELPVIFSSGSAAERVADLLAGPGPAAFLQKPYSVEQLRQALEQVLPGVRPH